MVSGTSPEGQVAGSIPGPCIAAPGNKKHVPETLAIEDQQNVVQFFEELKNIVKTGLHGFSQNRARPKKVCKKTRETSAGQRLATPIWKVQYRLSLGLPKS